MKQLLIVLSLLFPSTVAAQQFRQQVHPPYQYRQWNYKDGSCCLASMITILKWQGQHKLARAIKWNYSGGQLPESLDAVLNSLDIKYASTYRKNDVGFLFWACRTRRGAAVAVGTYQGDDWHMISLVHFDSMWAGLIDNNDPRRVRWMRSSKFVAIWKRAGSWAVTPIYTPPPPKPRKTR